MPYQYFSAVFAKNITQHALIAMTGKARKILDKGGTFGALSTNMTLL